MKAFCFSWHKSPSWCFDTIFLALCIEVITKKAFHKCKISDTDLIYTDEYNSVKIHLRRRQGYVPDNGSKLWALMTWMRFLFCHPLINSSQVHFINVALNHSKSYLIKLYKWNWSTALWFKDSKKCSQIKTPAVFKQQFCLPVSKSPVDVQNLDSINQAKNAPDDASCKYKRRVLEYCMKYFS